jgi:hypothetical protein
MELVGWLVRYDDPEPLTQWVAGTLPGGKADHSLPSNVEVKNAWSFTSTLPCV